MPGPRPAPTALKILKGVHPSRINRSEPKPQIANPEIRCGWAKRMSAEAKRFWRAHAPTLCALGILAEIDLPAFRILCELWSKWVKCSSIINRKGLTYKSVKENKILMIRKRPEVALADQLETQMLRYFQHFGMTAPSRGKITVGGFSESEDEDLD